MQNPFTLIRKLAGCPGDTISRRAEPFAKAPIRMPRGIRRHHHAPRCAGQISSFTPGFLDPDLLEISCRQGLMFAAPPVFYAPGGAHFLGNAFRLADLLVPRPDRRQAPGNSQVGPAAGWYVAMATIHAPSGPQDTAGGRIISVARQLFGEASLCPPDQWEETVMTPAAGTVTGRLIFPYKLRLCDVSTQF